MWFKIRPLALARMPSTRALPLNPRAPGAPAGPDAMPGSNGSDDEPPASDGALQTGAFHESSYELRTGLEINESEWPEEVTIPAALGES